MSTDTECGDDFADLAEAAIDYAKRGWPVFPVHGVVIDSEGQTSCDCGTPDCPDVGKHPRISRGFLAATTYPPTVEKWWDLWPTSNIGVATGPEFGVVLDIDPRNGSAASMVALEERHGPIPDTRRTRTGGRGEHRIFLYPEGLKATKPKAIKDLTGLDWKTDGGYVTPPSRHKSGARYEWVTTPDCERADLPDWLTDGMEPDRPAGRLPDDLHPWARTSLESECSALAATSRGDRNNTLYEASLKMGGIVAGGSLDYDVAFDALMFAALESGLDEIEADDVIYRGMEIGAERPRVPSIMIQSRNDALMYLEAVREVFASIPRSGHKGTRMRVCMETMLTIAAYFGGPRNFPTTTQYVSICAGSGKRRMSTALQELCEEGWLLRLTKGYQGVPSRWSIRVPAPYKEMVDMAYTRMGGGKVSDSDTQAIHGLRLATKSSTNGHTLTQVGHDAFLAPLTLPTDEGFVSVRRGLGKSAWIVWNYLQRKDMWCRPCDIQRDTGRSRSTIHLVLKELQEHGLVEREQSKVRSLPVTDDDLDLVAERFGTRGSAQCRESLYASVKHEDHRKGGSVHDGSVSGLETNTRPFPSSSEAEPAIQIDADGRSAG